MRPALTKASVCAFVCVWHMAQPPGLFAGIVWPPRTPQWPWPPAPSPPYWHTSHPPAPPPKTPFVPGRAPPHPYWIVYSPPPPPPAFPDFPPGVDPTPASPIQVIPPPPAALPRERSGCIRLLFQCRGMLALYVAVEVVHLEVVGPTSTPPCTNRGLAFQPHNRSRAVSYATT